MGCSWLQGLETVGAWAARPQHVPARACGYRVWGFWLRWDVWGCTAWWHARASGVEMWAAWAVAAAAGASGSCGRGVGLALGRPYHLHDIPVPFVETAAALFVSKGGLTVPTPCRFFHLGGAEGWLAGLEGV